MEVFFIISLITFAVVFFFKLLSESVYTPPSKEDNSLRNMRDSTFTDSSDDLNSIEVTYSVFGYDELGNTTFDMDVKDSDYEWLEDAEDLDSDYISENRKSLHKRIIRAIRKNMKEESFDPDDGMVEVYVSGCHRKEYHEEASSEHAHDFADEDDIEYTVSL